jgi:phage-related protein
VTGWATLGSLVAITADAALDLAEVKGLVQRVQKTIHQAPDPVRSAMNSFLIAVGSHVAPLTKFVLETGEKIGPVTADLGNNSCEVPFAPDQIRKVEKRGALGKKRKSAKC